MVMKKLFTCFIALGVTSASWADHTFKVCYYNQTNAIIPYNNEGLSHKWKSRGELVSNGFINPKENKCFGKIVDETMLFTDYITFSVANKWIGIVNPGLAKPYIIAQDAKAKKGGKLTDDTKDGKDNYMLNIFVTENGLIYNNGHDPRDQCQNDIIIPRKFK